MRPPSTTAAPAPSRRYRRLTPSVRADAGFTLIEMLVAMVVLLVGVLGTATMALAALQTGAESRNREAATNLARELVEAARSVPYGSLLTSTASGTMQSMGGLADASTADPGWQIERRGVTFTATVDACVYDDPKDGRFPDAAGVAGSCGTTPGDGSTTADRNGDDYRKVDVRVTWGTKHVTLPATVANPAGGFGPRILELTSNLPVSGSTFVAGAGLLGDEVSVSVTTAAATTLRWDAGDAKSGGELTEPGATSWSFIWPLGTPATASAFTCDTAISWVPDAPAYQLTVQPMDSSGVPGDLRTQIVAVDRSAPHPVCDFAGGRNLRHGVTDLQWRASFEGDVVSYTVRRGTPDDETADPVVCEAVRSTECVDPNPPGRTEEARYYVTAQQDNVTFGKQSSVPATLTVPAAASLIETALGVEETILNPPPAAPVAVTHAVVDGQPKLTWEPSSDTDGGSVSFYRIYRDGQALANRYARTSSGETVEFTDKAAGDVAHSYAVSAVDHGFAESDVVLARQGP